jgi:putative transposase
MPDRPGHFHRHRFTAGVISYAVWLYYRFPLSHRDVEELLDERGIEVFYETVRRWSIKFGPRFADQLRRREARPGRTWRLDEVFLRMNTRRVCLWRAIDEQGQVLDILVQARRDADAAERFFRRLLDRVGESPERIVTDKLASYAAAKKRVAALDSAKHIQVRAAARLNNRIERSHQVTRLRERRMRHFKSPASAQRFLSVLSHVCNHFQLRRHLIAAPQYRQIQRERLHPWRELTGTAAPVN